MFHVKICGVTTPADARMVAEAGGDAIGLNFVPGSPRQVDIAAARAVVAAAADELLIVGVFAGAAPAEMRRVAEAVGLDAIQLHGHLAGAPPVDPPEACAAVAPLPAIRAIRLEADGFAAARAWVAAARAAGGGPAMAVVDAAVAASAAAGSLGGTGAVVDWSRFVAAGDLDIPVALAGGLTPANVAEAILITRAMAVDVASGVEVSPGRKDPGKVRAFIGEARRAWAAMQG